MDLLESWVVFVRQPAWALLPAAVFALAFAATRSRTALAAAMLWLLYAALETGNKLRWTCSGECNIRVDLLLIAPGLTLLSLVAAAAVAARLVRRPRNPA